MDIVLQRILELIDERGHGEGTKLANAINLRKTPLPNGEKAGRSHMSSM